MLSCKFAAYFQNIFLQEHLWRAVSGILKIKAPSNMKWCEEVVLMGVWMKVRKIYDEIKTEKIIFLMWLVENWFRLERYSVNSCWKWKNYRWSEGTAGKGASICGGEDETLRDGKVDKDEGGFGTVPGGGVMNGKGELLVGCSGDSADFNDAGLNGFANGHKFDLMLVF